MAIEDYREEKINRIIDHEVIQLNLIYGSPDEVQKYMNYLCCIL